MNLHRAVALAVSFLVCGPLAVLADDVTLTTRDGSLSLAGTLLGFDGEFYRVDTEYGELTVDGADLICDGAGCPDPRNFVARMRVSGSASVGRTLLPVLIETFAVRNGFDVARAGRSDTHFTFELRERGSDAVSGEFTFALSTSDEGFADLIADEADLVISRREVSRDEAVLARQAGRGDLTDAGRSRILALDGIVPVVAIQNEAKDISLATLRRIVLGEIVDWEDLGQDSASIALHITDPGAGLFQAFLSRVMGRSELALPPGVVIHRSDGALAEAVSADPLALGLAAFSAIGNAQSLDLRGPCGLLAEPDILSLKSEDYPLTAPIFLYSPARRLPPLARDFLIYAHSPAAQAVVSRAGYVDQFPQSISLADQGQRLATAIHAAGDEVTLADLQDMIAALDGQARLTPSFRFERGSAILDAQSRSNVKLLAEALERGVFSDRQLTFAGFSDGVGDAASNRRLSLSRAQVVQERVRAMARNMDPTRSSLKTEGFGEALPMACDEVEWGRQVNRRVEVWLK